MKLDARLKKLEDKTNSRNGMWVTFTMKNYEDPVQKARVKQYLLDEYLAAGNPLPIGCIYWNEIFGPEICGEGDAFLGSHLTNPLADIMERIAENSLDLLDKVI